METTHARHPMEERSHLTRGGWPTHGYRYTALAPFVLAVASMNFDVGDWACYIGKVPGEKYDAEWMDIATNGYKCDEVKAALLFPDIAKSMKWRN